MKIINIIRKHGGEAYLVGGCVRDMILNRNPNDYDIATNLLPKDIIKIFRKVIPTGIEHLTVTVIMEGEPFEITTYRADGDYSDGGIQMKYLLQIQSKMIYHVEILP